MRRKTLRNNLKAYPGWMRPLPAWILTPAAGRKPFASAAGQPVHSPPPLIPLPGMPENL